MNQINTAAAITALSGALQVASKSLAGQPIGVSDLAPLTQAGLTIAGAAAAASNPTAAAALAAATSIAQALTAQSSGDEQAQQTAMQQHMQALADLWAKAVTA